MQRTLCKSKIHRATITGAKLSYEGSLTLDTALMKAADIIPYEKVQIVNVNNGERIETYVIPGKEGAGEVCLNGAAARRGLPGDRVIIISYAAYDEREVGDHEPVVILVNDRNQITSTPTKEQSVL